MDKKTAIALKEKMDDLAVCKVEMKNRKEAFDIANKELSAIIAETEQVIIALKDSLSTEAMAEFEKDPTVKKLDFGIGIQERTAISYNYDEALKFAKGKDMFLALDKKAFEKVAPSLGLDFVNSDKKTIVTFPKELKINE